MLWGGAPQSSVSPRAFNSLGDRISRRGDERSREVAWMADKSLDINADLGEGFGNWTMGRDPELMPVITTVNVACGFHASDPRIMHETVALAKRHGVAVGAHPGLPDLMGFGRRRMAITAEEAFTYTVYQVGALEAFCRLAGVPLHHVKPHGALYWMINEDKELSRAILEAIGQSHPHGMFYWPAPIPDHVVEAAEAAGVLPIGEFYVDLRYDDNAQLIIERRKSVVDIEGAVERARTFVLEGWIESAAGSRLHFEAESLCVHGDGPNAVEIAQAVRQGLAKEGVGFEAVQRERGGQ
jgi:UPF0271 protein